MWMVYVQPKGILIIFELVWASVMFYVSHQMLPVFIRNILSLKSEENKCFHNEHFFLQKKSLMKAQMTIIRDFPKLCKLILANPKMTIRSLELKFRRCYKW